MPPSNFVKAVDAIQKLLRTPLGDRGFKVRGRTFNRTTADGLTQVINLQMGSSDPPGTTYIPGLRDNLHGMFTINLGVYIPEVAEIQGGHARSWVQEYNCCVRTRLGPAAGGGDIWWHARDPDAVLADIQPLLMSYGLQFLERFSTREQVLAELEEATDNLEHCAVPRIVRALIFWKRGNVQLAKELLTEQATDCTRNPRHPAYVRKLAQRLGLGEL